MAGEVALEAVAPEVGVALWPGAGVEDDEQALSATATTLAAVMLTRAVRRDTKIRSSWD